MSVPHPGLLPSRRDTAGPVKLARSDGQREQRGQAYHKHRRGIQLSPTNLEHEADDRRRIVMSLANYPDLVLVT